jgi:K+/H+ antiporter YhaU regulatory subunit KhtT
MIGDWSMLLLAKEILENKVDQLFRESNQEMQFDSFQRFTYHQ